jgi:hypothetical protein
MVEEAPIGLTRLRVSTDRLPVDIPDGVAWLPAPDLVPLFVQRVPELIVSYADVAALMLHHLPPMDTMARHRVGLALPIGMRGTKDQWAPGSAAVGQG